MMSFLARALLIVVLSSAATTALAEESVTESGDAAVSTILDDLERQLRTNPDEPKLWEKYSESALGLIRDYLPADLDGVQMVAARIERFAEENMPDNDTAFKAADMVRRTGAAYRTIVAAKRTTLEKLQQQLRATPDDFEVIYVYSAKLQFELQDLLLSKPESAAMLLDAERSFLDALPTDRSIPEVESARKELYDVLTVYERRIDASRGRMSLIGRPAPPLTNVQSWVNGKSLTADDLAGKVVLLDFWAVYCAPCIAAFPELREWHETYSDRGLIIVGVTGRHGYSWDRESETIQQSDDDVSADQEGSMLQAFAHKHELPFRIALQDEGRISSAFRVESIPQVVLIDRQGIIRMIRVGHDEETAREIEEMIELLIAEESGAVDRPQLK